MKARYDATLTYQNAKERGMIWLGIGGSSYKLDFTHNVGEFLIKQGAILGDFHEIESSSERKLFRYHWYLPAALIEKFNHDIPEDNTLTYENAEERGFFWVEDSDISSDNRVKDIIDWLGDYVGIKGYYLGQPKDTYQGTQGVYGKKGVAPIRTEY
jgi:hypothetical protein